MKKNSQPQKSAAKVALIIIDMMNDLEFQGGEELYENALPAARQIAALKKMAYKSQVPVIYANDNFGHWRSDFRQTVEHCLHDGVRGAKLAEILLPDAEDYFILKPKNSAFYATPLAELLQFLDVKTLVLTGIATDNCVLFTANDAHLRNYFVVVPPDCVAAINPEDEKHALDYMRRALKARVVESASIDFKGFRSGEG
jgi:nicotinamidase-related amidase